MRQALAIAAVFAIAAFPATAPEPAGAPYGDFYVQVDAPAEWAKLLAALGLVATAEPAPFRIHVADSPAARAAGFSATPARARVAAIQDAREPTLPIHWERPLDLPVFHAPAEARVFTREKRTGAPLVAGLARERGGDLWLAAPPGEGGIERFPYLPQALADLGLRPPFRQGRLWAFFDYSYRLRADPDYLARRWRAAGVAGLFVSAWHFFEPDAERDAYLEKLLAACRREGLLVYCWLELPHVSERFWLDNPPCREQTAAGQDAQLDWRKLVNLVEPACAEAVEQGLAALLRRFAWDGANLAELYFESLHGPADPARFTPLSDAVRERARRELGFEPLDLFQPSSPRFWERDAEGWSAFVEFRVRLAVELHERFLRLIRRELPEAHLVVTQIDDLFDERMRPYLGADIAALQPLAEELDFTLLIEDPATLWSLGPERYPEIARRHEALGADPARLAIDINIVERYQQVYPTRRQAGGELLRLVSEASEAFSRTALYFERSIGAADLPLLPHAASGARLVELAGEAVTVEAPRPFGLSWRERSALVDGRPWPALDGETVWLPAGRHTVAQAQASAAPPGRVVWLNADLLSAEVRPGAVAIRYRSPAAAPILLDREPTQIRVDGEPFDGRLERARAHWAARLPSGEHEAVFEF